MPPASALQPVCLLCMDTIPPPESGGNEEETLGRNEKKFKEFIRFCKGYLGVNVDAVKTQEEDEGKQIFCGGCEQELSCVLKLWRELEGLRVKLLSRVGRLGEVIKGEREQEATVGRQKAKLRRLQGQLGIESWEGVKDFRMTLLAKCEQKGRRILPNLILERVSVTCRKENSFTAELLPTDNDYWDNGDHFEDDHIMDSPNSDVDDVPLKKIKKEPLSDIEKLSPHQTEVKLWSIFILYSIVQLENLQFSQMYQTMLSQLPFVLVGRASKDIWRVPSRQTMRIFCHLLLIFAYGYNCNLEEVLERYNCKTTLCSETSKKLFKVPKTENNLPLSPNQNGRRLGWRKKKRGRPKGWRKPLAYSTVESNQLIIKTEVSPLTTIQKKRCGRPVGWTKLKPEVIQSESTPTEITKTEIIKPELNEKRSFRKRSACQLQKMVEIPPPKAIKPLNMRKGRRPVDIPPDIYSNSFGFSFRCSMPNCTCVFTRGLAYNDHCSMYHEQSVPSSSLICIVCNVPFDTLQILMEHLQLQHEKPEEKTHHCFHCSEAFTNAQTLPLHQRDVHWMLPAELFCGVEECSETFASPEDLQSHLQSHQTSVFTCNLCHWPFLTEYQLKLHQFNHLKRSDNGSYSCPLCTFKTWSTYKLSFHFNETHGNPNKLILHSCQAEKSCPLWFFSKAYLNAHTNVHALLVTKSATKHFHKTVARSCMYCHEAFPTLKTKLEHERKCPEGPKIEDQLRSDGFYTCGKCPFKTKRKDKLQRHTTTHLTAKHQCPHCGKKFQRADHISVHIRRKHNPDEKHVCHLCGSIRATVAELRYHLTEHDMGHMCQECGKRFSRAWLLKVHVRTHTGERLQCQYCTELFREVPKLRSHLAECHPLEYEKEYDGGKMRRIRYKVVATGGPVDGRRKKQKTALKSVSMKEEFDSVPGNDSIDGINLM